MRGWRALTLALVLVVAGCAGGFGGGEQTAGSTPSATVTPTATETPDRATFTATATTTQSEGISDERRAELRTFAEAVDSRSTRPVEWRFEGPGTAVARVPAATDYRQLWDRRNLTTFEAVAEASAEVTEPPERILVEVENRSGVHVVTLPVNASVAQDYAEHRITTRDYRTHAAEEAVAEKAGGVGDSIVGVAAPTDQQRRWDYAIALNRSVILSHSEMINTSVTSGLVVIRQENQTYSSSAVRVTVRHPRELNNSETGTNEYDKTIEEQASEFSKVFNNAPHGEVPDIIQIQYVDEEGEVYVRYKITSESIRDYINGRMLPLSYKIRYIDGATYLNGGPDRE